MTDKIAPLALMETWRKQGYTPQEIRQMVDEIVGKAHRPNGEISTRDRVYNYIVKFISDTGVSPTIFEIAWAVHIKKTAVCFHLDKLQAEGRIERKFNNPRSIKVL